MLERDVKLRALIARVAPLIFAVVAVGCASPSPSSSPTSTQSTSSVHSSFPSSAAPSQSHSSAPSFVTTNSPSINASLPAPTATETAPVVEPSTSAATPLTWAELGDGAAVVPIWAPDGNYLLVDLATPHGDTVNVLSRSAEVLATASGVSDPYWQDELTAVAYQTDAVPGVPSGADGFTDYATVAGTSLRIGDPKPSAVILPCCLPLSNGHGAVAITRFLPEQQMNLYNPRYVVVQGGTQSQEGQGVPIAWDAGGGQLVVIHPVVPRSNGWLEVLNWPDLTSIFADDPSHVTSDATFDPLGSHVAYRRLVQDGSAQHSEIDIADLATSAVTTIPVRGDPTQNSTSSAWNDRGELVVASSADLSLSTYATDGSLVRTQHSAQRTYLLGSQNGTTLVSYELDGSDNPSQLQLMTDGKVSSIPVVAGTIKNLYLSPDGGQLVVTMYSNAGETAYVTDTR